MIIDTIYRTIKSREDDISTQISHITPSGFKGFFLLLL
ncbi:MAG: hypothetical protein JETT_3587 [Candidatus Jettenia ecosi]|uniref:Uncharacterized protein n=1 Tax=Candidatus Jettenia ecosi TaxID=2494326 RepID=A0A533Q6E7_9BACT|nr:MAG: hypothetical protein JETT_3587 [Candidatus Jettenia ecosi]